MDARWADSSVAGSALGEFAAWADIRIGPPRLLATSSSHSVFYTAESDYGQLAVKICVDTVLAHRPFAVEHEFRALRAAWRSGLAPRPFHYDNSRRALVQEFVTGESGSDWALPGLTSCIAIACQLMRAGTRGEGLSAAHVSYQADLAGSRALLNEAGDADPTLHRVVRRAREQLAWLTGQCRSQQAMLDRQPLVFSHNDVSPENMITTADGRGVLIDFETAALSRPDFLFGQIAVDAQIEDHLAGVAVRPAAELWDAVSGEIGSAVDTMLQRIRTLERLLFNAAYGLRQVGTRKIWRHDHDYVERKLAVARWCLGAIGQIRDEWDAVG